MFYYWLHSLMQATEGPMNMDTLLLWLYSDLEPQELKAYDDCKPVEKYEFAYMIFEYEQYVRHLWNTHDWNPKQTECPTCMKCGKSPIGLGFWGDNEWRRTHTGHLEPCKGRKDESR
ncbi:MAG: hypothetical protein KAJ19_14975 [Gammaproteobacteria bacterium]|nr:hypothetical protein [Gammaproteobacteria bacterium]